MAKGLAAGMTDYSHQSFKDILSDLINERRHLSVTIENLEKSKAISIENGYWASKVPHNVRSNIAYTLKFCQTTEEEFDDIINGIQKEVEEHHVNRLKSIADTASEININIGAAWHQEYDNKDYGNEQFDIVEQMYFDAREAAVNLLDIDNLASRLKVFVGKKGIETPKVAMKKILFLSASPEDQERLRVDVEARRIDERLQASKYRDTLTLIKKEAAKAETITKALLDNEPQFIHFTGHGDETGISIENEFGEMVLLPKSALVRLFKLFATTIEVVILNACKSGELAKEISELGFYVIGMNDNVDEQGSIDFSVGFYQAIGEGRDIEFAFNLGLVLISQHAEYAASLPVLWKNGIQVNTN